MTEEVKNKVRQIYDSITSKVQAVIQVFKDQFSEELVDSSLGTFEDYLAYLNQHTLGDMGINSWTGSNDYGSYSINSADYNANGRGKPFLEYIPDLGILDYLRPRIEGYTKTWMAVNTARLDTWSYLHLEGVIITIKFPEVTVTNEYDRSIVIHDLYVRVPVQLDGKTCDKFVMNRATFSIQQWTSNYSHSHLHSIDRGHLSDFRTPCTGSGPINNTINTLMNRHDLNIWGLYAFEIAKYVTVESIAGVPYRRLEKVGSGYGSPLTHRPTLHKILPYDSCLSSNSLREFIKYFISLRTVKVAFKGGKYCLGESYLDYWLKVSNAFIDWHNRRAREGKTYESLNSLMAGQTINEYIVSDGKVYLPNLVNSIEEAQAYEGQELFKFKGEPVKLHIINNLESVPTTLLVRVALCDYILTRILQIINYNYGRENSQRGSEEIQTSARTVYL